jgi:hypothetical protein
MHTGPDSPVKEMKKIIFLIAAGLISNFLRAQTYYIYDDSVFFLFRVEVSKKDSIEKLHFKIKNSSSTNLFVCKKSFRDFAVYINNNDWPLIIGCGCEYGFNQDYNNDKIDKYEVVTINRNDSLSFEINSKSLNLKTSRKMTLKEFERKDKIFKIDYVLSNNELLFLNKTNIYENFMKYKKRLTFFIPAVSKR